MRSDLLGALCGLLIAIALADLPGLGRPSPPSQTFDRGLAAATADLSQTTRRVPAASPLDESDVIKLLQSHIPAAQVGERARRQGIRFALTAAVEQQLREAGADSALLETLSQIQPRGLVWGPAKHVATAAEHGLVDVSDLVTENGKHYVVFTGDDKHVYLASDANGTWKTYEIYGASYVGNGPNQWYVGLVVRGDAIYVPFVTPTDTGSVLAVSYNTSLQGTWAHAVLFAADNPNIHDPFGTLLRDTLLVSFDMPGPRKTSDDVFVASIPLASLPAGGAPSNAPLPAQVSNVSHADDVQSGPDDGYAEIVPAEGGLDIAWQRAEKTLVFAQGQFGGPNGATWPPTPQLLNAATDEGQQSLQLAASGQTVVIAQFINKPNQGNGPGCCDVWATSNASGSWATQNIGSTNMALQKPGVAVSACGPSVAFQQAMSDNSERVAVSTFEGGRWVQQLLGENAMQPRLAATPDGMDLVYQSGYGDIFFQHAQCYPPPAPLHP